MRALLILGVFIALSAAWVGLTFAAVGFVALSYSVADWGSMTRAIFVFAQVPILLFAAMAIEGFLKSRLRG